MDLTKTTLIFVYIVIVFTNGHFLEYSLDKTISQENTCHGTVGKEPKDVSNYQQSSSLLQIFSWMQPRCRGFVTSITVATDPNYFKARRFYVGAFRLKKLRRTAYFQLIHYVAADIYPIADSSQGLANSLVSTTVVSLPLSLENSLPFDEKTYFGIFYDKWDMPQNETVIKYASLAKRKPNPSIEKWIPSISSAFPCYVGFFSLEELSYVDQMRIGSDLILSLDDRLPALSLNFSNTENFQSCGQGNCD